jgi:hypothetical protein
MASQGLSGGTYGNPYVVPTVADTYTWLMLQAAANCVADSDTALADRRADAFATIATTLINGDPVATQPNGVGPARLFQLFRNGDAVRWANNMAERYEYDIWKSQVAAKAPATISCTMNVTPSTNLAVDLVMRDAGVLPPDGCINYGGGATQTGNVTDANLWAWMYASPIGATLPAWQPYQGFSDYGSAVKWTWTTANDLAKQYTNK